MLALRRLANWRERFAAFLVARRSTPLVWGASDCCLLAADSALAIAGQDVAAPLRGYSTEAGAVRRLRRLGFESVESFLDSVLPRADRPRVGDVVLIPSPPLDVLMVADRAGGAWGQDALGLERFPIPAGARFWRVG